MELQVRTIDASEIGDWVACMGVGFLRPRAEGFAEYFLGEIDLDRTWGAFDSGRVVGTLRSFATGLTVPGPAEQDASAITNVTVVPTHRRQGLMRDMVIADLDSSIERGESLGSRLNGRHGVRHFLEKGCGRQCLNIQVFHLFFCGFSSFHGNHPFLCAY